MLRLAKMIQMGYNVFCKRLRYSVRGRRQQSFNIKLIYWFWNDRSASSLLSCSYITLYDRSEILTYILKDVLQVRGWNSTVICLVIVFQLIFTNIIHFKLTKQWQFVPEYVPPETLTLIWSIGITPVNDSSQNLLEWETSEEGGMFWMTNTVK